MEDTLGLGPSAARRAGSTPASGIRRMAGGRAGFRTQWDKTRGSSTLPQGIDFFRALS